jgi:PAS domain S-box-containing protein
VIAKNLNTSPKRSPRLWPVRTLLFWLVLACLLPGVIGAVTLTIRQYHVGLALLEKDTLQVTRAISQVVDRDLAGLQGKLQILGLSPALLADDIPTFYRQAQEVLATETLATAIVLMDSTGQQVMNTMRPLGAELPKTGHQAMVRQTFETGHPAVSDLYIGAAARHPFVALEIPVLRKGRVIYALDIGIHTERLNEILAVQNLQENWVAAILDGQGVIVARSHNAARFVGQKGTPDLVRSMLVASEGSVESTTLEGIPASVYYSRSPVTNWSVAIGIPRQSLEAGLIRSIALLGLGIAMLFGMGLGLAWFVGGRIARSVKALTEPAMALEAGDAVVVSRVHFLEADEVAQTMARTARLLVQRTQALRESHSELQDSEERYYTLVEHSPEAIAVLQDEKLLYVNPTGIALIGANTAQDLIGRPIFDFVPPDSRQALLDGLNGNAEHGGLAPMFEMNFIKLDGTPGVAEVQGTSIVYKGKPAFQASVRDITERKQASEQLRVSDLALKAVSEGVLITGANGEILSANGAFVSITGFSEAEILGRPCNFVQGPLTDPQTRAAIRLALKDATEFSGEILNYRKDGTTFWNELTISPAVNEQGQLTHFIGIIRDITERKLSMDEIGQHRQHLEQLVRSRTEELAHARDVAESATQAKSIFLATMSHELRTPLNAVVGLAGLLADSPLNRRQRDYADKVLLSARALRAIIDDILDFSKIEAGALQLEHAPFSLNALVRALATVVGISLQNKPIEALFDVQPDIPDMLIGDTLRLQQVILNLTSNAIKFTDAGTVVVSLRCIARDAERVTLQFAVRDTGIGLASEQLEFIFDEFVQADTSTNRLYGGTGLGLAISARLAHLMGGQIDVDSAEGHGSEFRFCVPVTLGRGESEPLLPQQLCGLSILIVEDHPLARELLIQTCAGFGWQATAVEGGAAGLEALRRSVQTDRSYDLLLLDWHMPGMNGLEMLRQAFATPELELPLVILMASIFELEQAVTASDGLQLDGIAAKPLTPSTLLEAVSRAYSGEYTSILPPEDKTDLRLAGMRLLVAEDNALNQEVVAEILIRAGAEVVIADNGLAAVGALRKPGARFDAVLMDIQMPIMDGYAATHIIREELGLVDLPIIAVTAFARPQDRDETRRAGMAGHLVKPLDVEDLLNILDKNRLSAPGRFKVTAATIPESPAPAITVAGLDVAAALKAFGGNQEMYLNLLRKFLLQHGRDTEEARRLFDVDDTQGAERILHGLSGIASILQATELARLTAVASNAALLGQADVMVSLFGELQAAMQTLRESVNRIETLWADQAT